MGIASNDDEGASYVIEPLPRRFGDLGPNPGEPVLRAGSPPVVPRRRRSRPADSSDDEASSDHQKKQRVDFANKLCDQVGVTPLQRSQVVSHSVLSTHNLILTIFAQGLATKSGVSADATEFAKSRVFREFIAPRLHATILDPNLESYVTGLTEQFVKHIRLNFKTYHLERSDLIEYSFNKSCNSAVSTAFTAYRAELKKKFFESVDSETDIGTLTQSFKMDNYQMTMEHWGRYAFIRSYILDYQSDVREGKKPGSFWTYIDKKLAKVRKGLLKHPEAERAGRLKLKIEKVLALDQKKYPFVPDENDMTSRPAVVVTAKFSEVPDWQLACEASLLEMQAYGSGAADTEDTGAAAAPAPAPAAVGLEPEPPARNDEEDT